MSLSIALIFTFHSEPDFYIELNMFSQPLMRGEYIFNVFVQIQTNVISNSNFQFAPFATTQPFTINGPTLTLDTPSGSVAAGQQITVTWDATNGFVADPFEIILTGGNPQVAVDLGSFSTSAQTSAEVTIPSTTTA